MSEFIERLTPDIAARVRTCRAALVQANCPLPPAAEDGYTVTKSVSARRWPRRPGDQP